MALVAFLKGVNVGGHRNLRPRVLAQELAAFDVVNVGAAGTFIIRKPVSRGKLRVEIIKRLPFAAEVMICSDRELLQLVASDPFAGHKPRKDIVPFVSVSARRRRPPRLPLRLPSEGRWHLQVVACEGRFVVGLHRRDMKAIGYLGQLEKIFRGPLTTRSWSTFRTLARQLDAGALPFGIGPGSAF